MKQNQPHTRLLRIASLLLSILTALPVIASCASETDGKDASGSTAPRNTETDTVETVDPNDRSQIKDSLPDNLDLGGKTYRIYCSISAKNEMYFQGPQEQTGEIVDDAILARNAAVEDRMNITLVSDSYDDEWNTVNKSVSKLIMAGDDTYDLFMGQQAGVCQLITENCFVNAYDIGYLDFSQPWWNNNYMNELSLGTDYRFFLMGDYFIDALSNARVVYFNKAMYANYFDDADALYEEVFDGSWTIDRMAELSRAVFVDLDNNGQTDETDQLGYVTYATGSSVDAFVYTTDVRFTSRDSEGFITLEMMSDDAVTLAEKLLDIFYQEGSFFNTEGRNIDIFAGGTALFLGNATFGVAKNLRDMKQDFGFLPYPKLDAEQDGYRTLVHDTVLIGGVSTASANLDSIGAVLEALCAETYRSVTPVWYETALKVKYSRDNLSTQMIDLIHDAMTTNFIFAYNYALNGIGTMYRELVSAKSADYASKLKTKEKAAQKKLDQIIGVFSAES